MRYASAYLKMRVLGALDNAPGRTRHERVRQVAAMTFIDENGQPRSFTWRTIQTWWYRYKIHGVTGMTPQERSDKGRPRKVTPEELLEAINAVLPTFHQKDPKDTKKQKKPTKLAIYRRCIEKGLLQKDRLAQTTFFRFVREFDLLKPDADEQNKRRRAFSMQYANQLWQADTMVGPFVRDGTQNRQARLIAFIDDASRVICHGEFFFEENAGTLVRALKAAFYKRGIPEQLLVDYV